MTPRKDARGSLVKSEKWTHFYPQLITQGVTKQRGKWEQKLSLHIAVPATTRAPAHTDRQTVLMCWGRLDQPDNASNDQNATAVSRHQRLLSAGRWWLQIPGRAPQGQNHNLCKGIARDQLNPTTSLPALRPRCHVCSSPDTCPCPTKHDAACQALRTI